MKFNWIDRIKRTFATLGKNDVIQQWLEGNDVDYGTYNYADMPAVISCVRVLSESVATLPLHVYRRVSDEKREVAKTSKWCRALHDKPNFWMTSYDWRNRVMRDVLLYGNSLSRKVYNNGSWQLWPVDSKVLKAEISGGKVYYTYRAESGREEYRPQEQFLHIRGLPSEGLLGNSVVQYAAQAVKNYLSTDRYVQQLFESGGSQRVALFLPKEARVDQAREKELQEKWKRQYGKNADIAIVYGGMEPKVIGMTANDAQSVELRKALITEVARVFRVPPHLIGDLERATFSNIAQQDLEFVKYSLQPWLEQMEQAIERDLLAEENDSLYAEFNVNGFLKADPEQRGKWYSMLKSSGIATTNEIRQWENMDDHPDGDELWRPVNMTLAGTPPPVNVDKSKTDDTGDSSNDNDKDDKKDSQ